jgi:hypothetical protein
MFKFTPGIYLFIHDNLLVCKFTPTKLKLYTCLEIKAFRPTVALLSTSFSSIINLSEIQSTQYELRCLLVKARKRQHSIVLFLSV